MLARDRHNVNMQQEESRLGFSALRASNLVDQIRDELQRAILSGGLAPGTALRDSVIAAEMGVSRAPVREALRTLQESGLLDKLPNRSYRVIVFDTDDWHELASMRMAYEGLAVRLSVARNSSSTELSEAVERLRQAEATQDDLATIAADWAFHEALVRGSGNSKLVAAYTRLRYQIQLALITNVKSGHGNMIGITDRHADLRDLFERAVATSQPSLMLPMLEDHMCVGMNTPPLPR